MHQCLPVPRESMSFVNRLPDIQLGTEMSPVVWARRHFQVFSERNASLLEVGFPSGVTYPDHVTLPVAQFARVRSCRDR